MTDHGIDTRRRNFVLASASIGAASALANLAPKSAAVAAQGSAETPDNLKYVAARPKAPIAPKTVLGVPKFVDHEKDLRIHPGYHTDSNFVVTNLKTDDGRSLQIILHQMVVNPAKDPNGYPLMLSIVSLSDRTNRWYTHRETVYKAGQFKVSTERLDISCATSAIKGSADTMQLWADLPDGAGRFELTLRRTGPVLDNCATGSFPFLSNEVQVWQFAFPYMAATGTLTLKGKTSRISGDAWVDRQWNDMSPDFFAKRTKWRWMNLNLSNNYKISVWDMTVDGKNENAWATVLSPQGLHMVADIVPLARDESDYWVSPSTKQKYATKYIVRIPSLDTELHVKVWEGLPQQEIVSPSGDDKYEAACTFEGRFMGQTVTGFNCLELVGNFS
jgi:predicted secreted hydrolase